MTMDEIAHLLKRPPHWLKVTVADVLGQYPDHYAVEDIIQDAIGEVILNAANQGGRTVGEIYNYLKTIAINKAHDYTRQDYVKLRDYPPTHEEEEISLRHREEAGEYLPRRPERSDYLIYPWEFCDLVIDVRRALSKLNPLQRRIAELYGEGFQVREIADSLNLKRSTVDRWWREDIARQLRIHLADYKKDSLRYLLRRQREFLLRWGLVVSMLNESMSLTRRSASVKARNKRARNVSRRKRIDAFLKDRPDLITPVLFKKDN